MARAGRTKKTLEKALIDTLAAGMLGEYGGPALGYDKATDEFVVFEIDHSCATQPELGRGPDVLSALQNAKSKNPKLWRK